MVRIFLIVLLLFNLTVNAQIGKTETEDYKAGFEQKSDIDEVSNYMLDYQLPIQVLNIAPNFSSGVVTLLKSLFDKLLSPIILILLFECTSNPKINLPKVPELPASNIMFFL